MGIGKAAATGIQPGVTRNVVGKIKVCLDPVIYLVDTPGIMVPDIGDVHRALKIGITGGLPDKVVDEYTLSDYLLDQLNHRNQLAYVDRYNLQGPTQDVHSLLLWISKRIGAVHPHNEPDLHASALFLLRDYRQGKLGAFLLDDM
jgi:hypothetical protein